MLVNQHYLIVSLKLRHSPLIFPFCTIEPNIGIITVPDERLFKISSIIDPEKTVPTTVEIVDIAGLVKGASKGEGLGNKFLANIRETNAIVHVLRCFDDDNIVHVDGSIDPVRDKETIDLELQLKDLETLEKIKEKNIRVAKSGNKEAIKLITILDKFINHLESGKSIRTLTIEKRIFSVIQPLQLITQKPVIYVCNVDENSLQNGNKYTQEIKNIAQIENAEVLVIATAIEFEIAELEDVDEQKMFLEDLGLENPGVNNLIKSAYKILDLETYFTAGKKEVRAWTILKGSKEAPKAAGVIHSDFEKGFIRAEVMSYNNFIKLGSEQACKDAGKLSVEGKDYIVKDGDIMHFRFNV